MKFEEQIKCDLNKFPFNTSLSFEYLIDDIKKIVLSKKHPMYEMAKRVLTKLEKVPELTGQIDDESIIDANRDLVNEMMAFVINPLSDNTDLAATCAPLSRKTFYSTSLFRKTLAVKHRRMEPTVKMEMDEIMVNMIYYAYLMILEQVYNYKINFDIPFTFRLIDDKNKTVKYYRKNFNLKYVRVIELKKAKKLSEEEIKELFDNSTDLNLWNKKIPLKNFKLNGFMQFNFTLNTHDFVISELKSDLLDKNTILTKEGFELIRARIRALMDIHDLEFGLAAVHDFESSINRNFIWQTIIGRTQMACDDYAGTFYERALHEKRIFVTDDFKTQEKDRVSEAFLKKGLRSHALVPLILEDEIVGMLEFASKKPGDLHMLRLKSLLELFPVFALALKRSKDEWNDRVRAVIQEQFTAIHPTVEWKFRDAVSNMLEGSTVNNTGIEPIIFNDVIPIYGASDVRGSSLERNKAIQADLTEQLEHAKEIIEYARHFNEMPLLNDLSFKIGNNIKTVKTGLKAGDEVLIIEFLKKDIDPTLKLLKDRYEELDKPVEEYFKKLDPELGVLYKKRKDFEGSLTKVNDVVGDIIDKEQEKAQKVYPHYFEKYRTDGVEYNAYIGQSLVKNLTYSDIYLKNIRLWQLLVKVKVAREIRKLQSKLKTKLDITQLILVHSNPLSIAFRQDEKKFDVAGAYNIRYEITKKRIDKAVINGTKERITQTGKIAIIYSHGDEIEEYKKYIDFMIAQKLITPNIEDVELEDLQGASGLRALRIEVDFNNDSDNYIDEKIIRETVTQN